MNYTELKQYLADHQFTWLITGVAGFIGSNLMETLLALNQKVVGLDNFATGHKRNIDEVLQKVSPEQAKNFTFYEGDIRSLKDCEQVMRGVDYVLHQAALGSVPRSIKDPVATHEVNASGFLNVLTAAKDNEVKRFVYASSSSVYGDSPVLPKVEINVGSHLSPYAVSKHVGEHYAKVFSLCYGMETIGLRYFNVFGARQDPHGVYAAVIPLWFKAMLSQDSIYINGDGKTTRDFCYVENVVQANLLAAFSDNIDAINTIYNVAVGEQTSLGELFVIIRSLLGCPDNYNPVYREFRSGDVKHSLANIEKAKKLLKYNPEYKIRDGLRLACDWYMAHLQ